ncbi:putative ATP-dependent RNA helicase rok1, partial [Saccharata proteae CBS 121410]
MDIFKILSRSTNLSKGGAHKSVSVQKTPSSGATQNPQLFGHDDSAAASAHSNGQPARKKRKRGQNSTAQVAALPAELDFFGDAPRENEPAIVNGGAVGGQDGTSSSEADLNEEECKRVLRQHKVKVTLLEDYKVVEPEPKSKKRKKSKTKEEPPAKKNKVQLFPQPLTSFTHLRSRHNISRRLADNLEAQGYSVPTEVQLASLPILLEPPKTEGDLAQGHAVDMLTVAPTGSGKTLAFLIPVITALLRQRLGDDKSVTKDRGIRAVILAPTKELASQITNEGRKLALRTGIKVSLLKKGMEVLPPSEDDEEEAKDAGDDSGSEEVSDEEDSDEESVAGKASGTNKKRRKGQLVKADILVSTPLTLLHALQDSHAKTRPLDTVQFMVLDEADVLLDPLFREQTLDIWNACTNAQLRVSLWSATMGSNVEELAKSTINSRWAAIEASSGTVRPNLVRLVVGLKDSAIPNIAHKLTYAATEQGKLLAMRQILHPTAPTVRDGTPSLRPPFLIFTQTIPRAQALYSELQYDIPPEAGGSSRIAVLHSSLSSSLRDSVMARFRKGEVWVLITTDLLSRGVDFRGVNGVVNYDAPTSGAAYVHRVGRTGRAGREGGVAITLYTEEDIPYIKNIANIIKASEKLRGEGQAGGEGTVQQWLLDALPTPSKRDKQKLKKRGVEARRPGAAAGDEEGRGKSKTRISTKSGFERKVENKRRGAVEGSRKR